MIIKGDIDGDGKINGKDLRTVQAILLTKTVPEGEAFIAADVDNDNEISTFDLAIIYMHLSGVEIINEVIE